MEQDYDEYGKSWDQVDEAPARDPLPPEPPAKDANADESGAMAREFDRAEAMPVRESKVEGKPLERAEPKTFGEAFKAARAEGKPTFVWQGKRYTTELRKDKPARPAAKPVEKTVGRGLQLPQNDAPAEAAAPAAPAAPTKKPSMLGQLANEIAARRAEVNPRNPIRGAQ